MGNNMGETEPKIPIATKIEPSSTPKGKEEGVVFVGSSEGEEKNAEAEKQKAKEKEESNREVSDDEKKQPEKKTAGQTGEKKTKTSDALKQAAEKNPILSDVLERHPIQTATVESFIMTRLHGGQSAEQIGKALKQEVIRRRFSDEAQTDARGFLTKLAIKTQNPEFIVPISGGSGHFTFYEERKTPGDPSKREQYDRLDRELKSLDEQWDAVPPLGEEMESLNAIARRLYDGTKETQGKGGVAIPPEYDRKDVDRIAKNIGRRRQEIAQESKEEVLKKVKHQEEEQKRREDKYSSMYLSREEEIRLAVDSKSAVERWLRRFYEPFGYPSGGEQASQDRVRMFLGYLESAEYQREYFLLHKNFPDDVVLKEKGFEELRTFLDNPPSDGKPLEQQDLDNFHDTVKSTKTYVEAHTNL